MLQIKNISKSLGDFTVKNMSFEVQEADYLVLLGESGAGKSVILEMIAGLIDPDSGHIFFNGKDITKQRIQERKFGLVFQDYAIFPHLSVRDNIAYPLKNKRLSKTTLNKKIIDICKELGIAHLTDRNPTTLSGGEQQRVALARTLIMDPLCLLLDEPLASLDVGLKIEFRSLLRRINQKGITIVHVTHDYEEAISLARHIAIIQNGSIVQTGTPEEVFQNPKNRFVANLTGMKNFFKAALGSTAGQESKMARINDKVTVKLLSGLEDGPGHVLIRSRDIILSNQRVESTASNNFEGMVEEMAPSRYGMEICVDIGIRLSVLISKESMERIQIEAGKKVWVSFKASAVKFYKN